MEIAFDNWLLSAEFRSFPIYVYAKTVLAELLRLSSTGRAATIHGFVSRGCANDIGQFEPAPGLELKHTPLLRMKGFWRAGGIALASASIKADVIYCPDAQVVPLGSIPTVAVVHDVSTVKFPRQFSDKMATVLRILLWTSVKLSARLIAISENTKRDVVELYGVPPERITVVRNGYNRKIFNTQPADPDKQNALLARHQIRHPYILHHGVIQPRKNLERLIEAHHLLRQRRRDLDLQLVLAGPLGWRYEPILRAARRNSGDGKVVFTGALPEQDLALMVKGATACVIPSLYEGFSLPMVEAMACSVPTLAANTSCLPERSGGVLRYFDPLSVEDMADAIEQVLEDGVLRERLAREGRKRAAEFSWERCARETLDVLMTTHEELTGKSRRALGAV